MIFKKNFFLRTFWGGLYVIIVLLSISLNFDYFKALMIIFSFLCLGEFFIITNLGIQLSIILLSTLTIAMTIDFFLFKDIIIVNPMILLVFFSPIIIIFEFFSIGSFKKRFYRMIYAFFSLFYIFIPFILACQLYLLKGRQLILGIFLLIWINDTFSYIIGYYCGKRKLAPHISPGKTIEGFLGGITFCVITAIIFYYLSSQIYWIVMGFIVGIFGTIGDLVESFIKRVFQVKDSGSWLSVHGGFLDRLDSFIFTIPIVMIYITFFY